MTTELQILNASCYFLAIEEMEGRDRLCLSTQITHTPPLILPSPHLHLLDHSRGPAHTSGWLGCVLFLPAFRRPTAWAQELVSTWKAEEAKLCRSRFMLCSFSCLGYWVSARAAETKGEMDGVLVFPRAAGCAQSLGAGLWTAGTSLSHKTLFPRLSPPPHCGLRESWAKSESLSL